MVGIVSVLKVVFNTTGLLSVSFSERLFSFTVDFGGVRIYWVGQSYPSYSAKDEFSSSRWWKSNL